MQRDLRPLFEPRSVAIVGASDDPAKWGNWLARGALSGEHARPVYLVNRTRPEVLGRRAYASVAELPEAPDLVVIAVPAGAFEDAVDDSLERGARALVGITAGLGESGPDGAARERALVERVRAAGAMLLGPNCLGLYDAGSELGLSSNEFSPGAIGLVSQSGNLALEMGLLSADAGLGFSRFASVGNQADLALPELVTAFARHEPTRLIAVYVEDFRDGRAFVAAAAESVRAGKPVVVLTVGRSDAATRAARSHTGALVSPSAVVDAALRAAGAHRVRTPAELIDLAQALLAVPPRRGRRVAVVGDGGGHGAIAADVVVAAGLEVPPLTDELGARLAAELPATAATRNPVDLAGGGEQDIECFARVTGELLRSGEVDAVLMTGYFGGYSVYHPDFGEREVAVARRIGAEAATAGRPLLAQTMYPASPSAVALRAGGVPVYRTIEAATSALAALEPRAPVGLPELPEPQAAASADGYFGARALLAAGGIPFAPARPVRTLAEAELAAGELGYPVVLKALGLLHKSDAGGVALDLPDAGALASAFEAMERRLAPPGFSLEAAAARDGGVELIVGVRRDARFGPVAMVGIGGLYAELLEDVGVALAPLDDEEAARLLLGLRGAGLLQGARGRPPLDLPAAAAAAAALSRVAAARPDLAELEVNPLLVTPHGVLALDARAVPEAKGAAHAA